MEFSKYVTLVDKEPFFEHDIFNTDGREPIDGFSIDFRSVSNNYVFKNSFHSHNFLEMELIVSGSGIHQINGQNIHAHRGYMSLTRRTDFHNWKFKDGEKTKVFNIAFNAEHISSWVANQIQKYDGIMDCFLSEEDMADMIPLLKILYNEFKNPDDDFKVMRKSLMSVILVCFMRHITKDAMVKTTSKSLLIQKVLHYVEEHFTENDISLYTVSEKLDVTPNYLGRIIKETIGMSFIDYVTEKRLSYSLKLLNQNVLKINQVAQKSGFSSSNYFILKFKRYYGLTPGQYLINRK